MEPCVILFFRHYSPISPLFSSIRDCLLLIRTIRTIFAIPVSPDTRMAHCILHRELQKN